MMDVEALRVPDPESVFAFRRWTTGGGMRLRHLLSVMLVCGSVQAQSPRRVVAGTVFDSINRAPLAGAIVQVALVDLSLRDTPDASAPRIYFATADSGGHYRVSGLPRGSYAIGFQHDALNALGIESPLRAFLMSDDSSVTVDLAIPSGRTLRSRLCGHDTRLGGEGLLVGYVLDARRERLLPGAVVRARWLEFALEVGNYRAVTRSVTAIVGEDGRYLACGLTSDEAVVVEVTMPGYRRITNRIAVPSDGSARQDFRLADADTDRGVATLAGRVLLPDGTRLAAGQVVIDALALEVAVRNGDFSIAGVPPGTWSLEARAIGFEPAVALADASDRATNVTTLMLGERTQTLDAITIRGRRGGDAKILGAIASRRSTSLGTVFLPGNVYLESSYDPADALRAATGFRYVSPEVLLSSGCGFRYPPAEAPPIETGPARARARRLAVYLDGARVAGGLAELRTAVTMRDILAMEAYQDIASAPMEWRTNDACSVLAIWTKR